MVLSRWVTDTRHIQLDPLATRYAQNKPPYTRGPLLFAILFQTAVQRGSVQYLSVYPSDPGTPNVPAYENATRIEGWNTPKIPSLPISFANAERLLEEIGGIQECRLISGRVSETTVKLVNHGP
jgi:N-acetylated-alpha-linked acidic dipeptidase